MQPPTAESPLTSLTRLVPVPIKDVWPSEASHFTPWLLESGDLLSKALGVDLTLTSREHRVGSFLLDIIGAEVGTDNIVIVENQFGQTDHNHLGQLLTYVGGTQPTTIVWVAERFREEHRAALDWLNMHTEPRIRFFGVQISAVTLEGAPPGLIAPSLEVVVKPNDWEKRTRAEVAAGTSEVTAIQELYREFWSRFEPLAKERAWTNGSPPAQNWWSMPTGVSSVTWAVSYAMFGCRSELFFGDSDPAVNHARWTALASRRAEIKQAYGDDELIFDELPGKKSCRIEARLNGPKIGDRESWNEVIRWMVDTQERLRRAVTQVGGVPRDLANGAPFTEGHIDLDA